MIWKVARPTTISHTGCKEYHGETESSESDHDNLPAVPVTRETVRKINEPAAESLPLIDSNRTPPIVSVDLIASKQEAACSNGESWRSPNGNNGILQFFENNTNDLENQMNAIMSTIRTTLYEEGNEDKEDVYYYYDYNEDEGSFLGEEYEVEIELPDEEEYDEEGDDESDGSISSFSSEELHLTSVEFLLKPKQDILDKESINANNHSTVSNFQTCDETLTTVFEDTEKEFEAQTDELMSLIRSM